MGLAPLPIHGGALAPEGTLPGVGAIMYAQVGLPPRAGCTGTLIAPDAVLTAAHCVDPAEVGPPLPGFTLAHDATATGAPVVVAGRDRVIYPGFDATRDPGTGVGRFDDLGVLFLATPITDVAPAALDQGNPALTSGVPLTIAGYGESDTGLTGVLYQATAPIIVVGAHELQIADSADDPQPCFGDSGGPALLTDGSAPILAGVTSRGYAAGSTCEDGALYTRVDAYLEWIHGEVPTADVGDLGDGGCCSSSRRHADPAGLVLPAVLVLLRRRVATAGRRGCDPR